MPQLKIFGQMRQIGISQNQQMECEWQFKYAFAAIDRSYCIIQCPAGGAESTKQYYNFKYFYLVVLLALVDAHYSFI